MWMNPSVIVSHLRSHSVTQPWMFAIDTHTRTHDLFYFHTRTHSTRHHSIHPLPNWQKLPRKNVQSKLKLVSFSHICIVVTVAVLVAVIVGRSHASKYSNLLFHNSERMLHIISRRRRPLFTTNELKHSQQEFSSPSKLSNRSNSLFSSFGPLFLRLTYSRNLYRLCTVWLFSLCVIPPSKLKIEILILYSDACDNVKERTCDKKKKQQKKTMNFFCFGREYFSTTEQMSVHKNCQLTVECMCVNGIAVCLCLYLMDVRYFCCCVFCT